MKKINAKPFILIGLIDVFVIFSFLFIWTSITCHSSSENPESSHISIIGEYSTDGQSWNNMPSSDSFDDSGYEKAVFRGKFSQNIPDNCQLIIPVCNVWAELKVNGKTVATNLDNDGIKTDTPGTSILYIPSSEIPENANIELTLRNPYSLFRDLTSIKDTLNKLTVGDKGTMYNDLLKNHTVDIIISLAICFLGLFAFSLAGMMWQNVRYKNLALSFLAVAGGLYVLSDSIYLYMPLWIDNPVMCMIFDEFNSYLLPIAAFLYVRVNVEDKRSKTYLSVISSVMIIFTVVSVFLQLFGITDILKTQIVVFPFIILGVIGCIVCLVYEAFKLKLKSSKKVLISLCPMIAASLIDAVNVFTGFAPERIFIRIGLLLTVIIQMYMLFRETKQHQKELLQYQEMQNELLKMRVSIMVSQIQPHFLYNALTSIACLCEKDPPQAKKSIIEFSEYLRSNMNSLKEQAPVPFENELKHLKTYLSLEKMRFGDELNIKYDIQTKDFTIPSLTVQPLVENAVKHGVGMLEDGGTVTISTCEYDDRYEVIVSDNGVGFDPEKVGSDGKIHVGMENVRNRLKSMCNAVLNIESTVGKGTKATITIPKEEK